MTTSNAGRGPLVLLTATLLVPVLAGLAVVVQRASESPLESTADVEPVIVVAEEAVRTPAAAATVAVTYAVPFEVATQSVGTVTAIQIGVGDELASGDVILSVDDRDVIAYEATEPLWRDLGRGAKGDDVGRFQQLLTALGLEPGGTPGTVTADTLASIRTLNARLGRAEDGSTLRLAALAWIGSGSLTVSSVSVRQGATVGPGAPVLAGPQVPDGVDVVEIGDLPAEGDLVLAIGETSVPYARGSGRIDDDASAASIAAALGAKAEGNAQIRATETTSVASIPAGAVVTDEGGRTCVFVSADSAAQVVEPLGGSIGSVELPAEWIGREVLANPRDVREDLTCGS